MKHILKPREVIVEASRTEPKVTVTSTLPRLETRDVRLLVLASLLNEIEDDGKPTGIPPQAHQWARLATRTAHAS